MSGSFRFTNADVLIEEELQRKSFCFENGLISDLAEIEVDASGYWILPGIVDLHGDGFEHHLNPRPSASFDIILGLRSAERELSANGITTAYFAQAYSWEGGYKSPSYAKDFFNALCLYRKDCLTDIRAQVRYEILMLENTSELISLIKAFDINYLVYNNHIPVAQKLWKEFPERIEGWAAKSKRTGSELMAVVNGLADNGSELKNQLSLLSAELTKIDIMIGSHDDSSQAERSYFNSLGATICEFPTSIVTAEYARSIGNPVIMGAPNVVRGGSQSGSISATDLIMADLCDALVSDYYYPALANSVWTLHDKDLVRFERAWGLISLGPARALNLNTKGQLKIGYCADFVVMDPNKRLIEATFCNGKPTYMSGNFASKVLEKNI